MCAINRSKTNSSEECALALLLPYTTAEIERLDMALGAALEKHRINPSKANLSRAQILEKDFCKKRNAFETKSFLDLISRLEGLHQVQKMSLFYRKVRERTESVTNPTFVIHNPDSPKDQPTYSTTKEEYINFWTCYLEKTFKLLPPMVLKKPATYQIHK